MPCNSSYMEPTAREHQESKAQVSKIKDHLDHLVHQADLMREDILAVAEGRQDQTKINFSMLTLKTDTLTELLAEHDQMYVSARTTQFNTLVKNVRKQYRFVVKAGKTIERERALPADMLTAIHTQQILHRFGDMIRVFGQYTAETEFTPAQVKDIQKFAKIDYTKPLIPQIGFDPDDV